MGFAEYDFVRSAVGVLFFLDLLSFAPWFSIVFGEAYWGRSAWTRPGGRALVAAVWALGAASLVTGAFALFGAAALLFLFRRLYIANRWKNLFRGGGAPGFMAHYAARLIVLAELARELDPSGGLTETLAAIFAIDLGVILACSGIYKCVAGYLGGEGMEYGLVNPMWSYVFDAARRLSPRNLYLRFQDMFAPLCQLAGGVCLIVPATRPAGALLFMASFAYLLPLIRLGRLAVLLVVLPLLLLGDLAPRLAWAPSSSPRLLSGGAPEWAISTAGAVLVAYVVALVVVKAVQYLNFYANKKVPAPLQTWVDRFANWVPIIVWRVFTPDVTNFFVLIDEIEPSTGAVRPLLSLDTYRYGNWRRPAAKLRFQHVCESIALVTVFTSLKYFRSNRALFEERILKYAGTLGASPGSVVRFRYHAIRKAAASFEYAPAAEYDVDLAAGTVVERILVDGFSPSAAAVHSPIRETSGYGTYLPR